MLSVIILKDTGAAFRASILFCFNPASIFYSSIYSESLYSLLSVGGLYHFVIGSKITPVLLFALSSSARSNGMLNAGYICFQTMHHAYDAIFEKKHVNLAVPVLIAGVVRSLCIFAPFIAFQVYGYYNICLGRLPDEQRPWCKARLPYLYDYIQSYYWGVGFLRYFQFKQVPNFLLASPILCLASCSLLHYAMLRPIIVFSLGFGASGMEKSIATVLYSLRTDRGSKCAAYSENVPSKVLRGHTLRQRKQKRNPETDGSF